MDKYQAKVKNYSDSFLLETRNRNKVSHKFMNVCAWIFIPCGGGFFFLGSTSNASYFSLIALLVIMVGALCALLAVDCRKIANAADVEIAKRGLETNVEQGYEKQSRGLKKAIFIWLAIVLSGLVVWGIATLSGTSGGDDDGVRCPNCGTEYREGHSAAEFIEKHGHCPYCNNNWWD